ncbi:MAG: tetratricopeptide repeat protein [Candidatus Coatesbacteria bacterium]|nr:tetratricopeptide repeat protein [Candidatus Coatesbacteria bacterium]
MQPTIRIEPILRIAFVATLSFALFISPLMRVDDDPLGLIKWFVAHCGAVLMLAGLVLLWVFVGRIRIYNSPYLLPILAMISVSALSLLWATPRFECLTRMRYILLSWAPFFLCLLAPLTHKMRRIAAVSLMLGVSVCSGIGVVQYFDFLSTMWSDLPWEPELGKRVFSTMWNPNYLAGLIILVLPVMLGLARTTANRWGRISLLLLYYLNFCCLLFTNSWGGWSAYVASLILMAVAEWRARRQTQASKTPRPSGQDGKSDTAQWSKAMLVLIVLCAISAVAFFASKGKTVAGTTVGLSEREKMWNSSAMLVKRHPMGLGVGNFAVYENKYEHNFIEPLDVTVDEFKKDRDNLLHNSLYCHNEYLETPLETGFIGLAILFWLIIIVGRSALKSRPPHDVNPQTYESAIMARAVAVGAAAVFVHSIVSYPLRVPTTVTTLAALLGLFAPRFEVTRLRFRLPWAVRFLAIIPIFVATVFGCMIGYRPMDAEGLYVNGMKLLLADKDYPGAIKAYERAIDFGLPRYDVFFKLGEAQLKAGNYGEALETYRHAAEIQPYHEYSYFGIAEASREMGRTDVAIANDEKAIEFEPRFYDAYVNLARLKRSKGSLIDASETLELALRYLPRCRELSLDAAAISVELGKNGRAREYLDAALAYDPSDSILNYDLYVLREAAARTTEGGPSLSSRLIDSESAEWLIGISRMGALFVQEKKYEAARREFETVLRRFPMYPAALSNIATTYFLQGDTEKAKGYLQQAISVVPNHVPYRIALADMHVTLGELESAEEELERAIKIDPQNSDIIRRLNRIQRRAH